MPPTFFGRCLFGEFSRRRFPPSRSMIISDRYRFVFVHNPKCGGTVFRDAVRFAHDHPVTFWEIRKSPRGGPPLDYAHLRLWELRELYPDVYERLWDRTSFVFVRDPMRRFVSALHHHFREYRRPVVEVDRLGSGEKLSLFQRFVRSELSVARVLDDPCYVHFSPQTWFCTLDGEQVVKHILPFENQPLETARTLLQLPLQTDKWRDENNVDTALLEDALLNDFAVRFYAEDYAFFSGLPRISVSPEEACGMEPAIKAA